MVGIAGGWFPTRGICLKYGTELLILSSRDELCRLDKLYPDFGNVGVWGGAFCTVGDFTYYWANSEPVKPEVWMSSPHQEPDWSGREPGKFYCSILIKGEWWGSSQFGPLDHFEMDDGDCFGINPYFICEKSRGGELMQEARSMKAKKKNHGKRGISSQVEEFTVRSNIECSMLCLQHGWCNVYNIVTDDTGRKTCEIIDDQCMTVEDQANSVMYFTSA